MKTTVNLPFTAKEVAEAAATLPKSLYDISVMQRAFFRAGQNQNIHGHIHEVLFVDKFNMDIANRIQGLKAVINENPIAKTIDVKITDSAGKMIHKIQLKDCPKSPEALICRNNSGYYNNVQVKATKETIDSVEALKSSGQMSKPVTESGISTAETKATASKMPFKNAGGLTAGAVGKVALRGGVAGAAIGVGIEVISSGLEFKKGNIGKSEYAFNIGASGVVSGAAGATGGAVSLLAAAGVATALTGAAISAPVWLPTAVGIGASVVAGGAVATCGKWATTKLKGHVIKKSYLEEHALSLPEKGGKSIYETA